MNQKQTNPEPLGAPTVKMILVVAMIVCLGALAGVIGHAVKNKAVKIKQSQVSLAPKTAAPAEVNSMFYCDSKEDCAVVNFECGSCECDLKAINKNYKDDFCKNF